MDASEKIHMISTKYFRSTNQGHYMIYLQNMKFVWLIFWPEGAYTDYAYTTTVTITIPYYDSFHESRLYRLIMAKPNEPKRPGIWVSSRTITFFLKLNCLIKIHHGTWYCCTDVRTTRDSALYCDRIPLKEMCPVLQETAQCTEGNEVPTCPKWDPGGQSPWQVCWTAWWQKSGLKRIKSHSSCPHVQVWLGCGTCYQELLNFT